MVQGSDTPATAISIHMNFEGSRGGYPADDLAPPPVWRCVGCHPVAEAALVLYEQKKELKVMTKRLVRYC